MMQPAGLPAVTGPAGNKDLLFDHNYAVANGSSPADHYWASTDCETKTCIVSSDCTDSPGVASLLSEMALE